MSKMKNLLITIQECDLCYGKGMTGWVAPDGEYDFEYCDCNPYKLILDNDGDIVDMGELN